MAVKITRTFTRRNNEKLTLTIEIDEEKIAETMAHRMALAGKSKATAMDGGVIATVVS
jgi:hypothetical protein